MFKLIRAIVILILFIVCTVGITKYITQVATTSTKPIVDPKLREMVDDWHCDMRTANIDYLTGFNRIEKIGLVAQENQYAGKTEYSTRSIKINCRQLETGYYRTKATVYHELGHYVFKLEHGSCAIMQESCPSEEELEENWKEWVNEYLQLCINNSFESKY